MNILIIDGKIVVVGGENVVSILQLTHFELKAN